MARAHTQPPPAGPHERLRLDRGHTDTGSAQVFAQVADIVFAAHTAVMRTVQRAFNAVQLKAQPRAMARLDAGTQMLQQRLDVAPVNISADRFLQNGSQNTFVLVAHTLVGL